MIYHEIINVHVLGHVKKSVHFALASYTLAAWWQVQMARSELMLKLQLSREVCSGSIGSLRI